MVGLELESLLSQSLALVLSLTLVIQSAAPQGDSLIFSSLSGLILGSESPIFFGPSLSSFPQFGQ